MSWVDGTRRELSLAPPITNRDGKRSAEMLRRVVEQFEVEKSERYRAGATPWSNNIYVTHCNRFVVDVLEAMLTPEQSPKYQRANDMHKWLGSAAGRAAGWRSVGPKVAMFEASLGRPVVATWPNPNASQSGHVAIVVPARGAPGLWIAQAGSTNFSHGLDRRGFGSDKAVSYWSHD